MIENLSDIIVSNLGFTVHKESNAAWKRNLVNQTHFLLIYAEKGSAFYTVNGQKLTIQQGDIAFFNKGQAHAGYADPKNPWTYYTAAFDALNGRQTPYQTLPLPLLTHSSNPELCHRLFETLHYEWTARSPGYLLRCRGIISELLCTLIRESQTAHKQRESMEQVKRYIIAHFTENFTIEELAAMANVSQSHFHRLFKENTGVSAKQYLNHIRMNRAQALIQSGEHNISEVARMVGYNDIYYFSRLFKKITGVPPSSFIPR